MPKEYLEALDMAEKSEIDWEWGYNVQVVGCAAIMAVFVLGTFLHRFHISLIPESMVAVAAGALIGWIFRLMEDVHFTDDIYLEGVVNAAVLNLFLLPIIIFESGWSLRLRDFASQLGYILIFAIFGTLVSMFVIAGLILLTSDYHGIQHGRTAFAFAILISAVDPVATLATYSHLNVDPLLNILVFGESIINDAVAIAIFSVLNGSQGAELSSESNAAGKAVGIISWHVFCLLFGSIGLGLALGTVYVLIIRFSRMKATPAAAILFIFASCFFTFGFAEHVCSMSGIITVLFCAIMLRAYATPHLTVEGRLLASFLLKQMASLADMTVFVFVGIALVFASSHGLLFGVALMGFCILGRVLATVPLGLVTNGIKMAVGKHLPAEKRHLLTWKHIFMMCHAGLRGGIALVLVLELGGWVDETEGAGSKETLRNAALVVIVGFLCLFGGTTQLCLKLLGIRMGDEVDSNELLYNDHEHGCFMRFMVKLRGKAVLPILVGSHPKTVRMDGGVMAQIMANHSEEPRRSISSAGGSPQADLEARMSVFDLFGTMDPDAAYEGYGPEEEEAPPVSPKPAPDEEAPPVSPRPAPETSDVVPI